jgi:hypothetical protein
MNKQSSRKLNQNSLSDAYDHRSNESQRQIVSPRACGMYRPTNVWIDASSVSLASLLSAQNTINLNASNLTVYYAAANVVEQNVFSEFVAQWNSFAKAVNGLIKETSEALKSPTITTVEVDKLRESTWRVNGLSVIDKVVFIDDNTKETAFEVCRDLVVGLASSSIGLHRKAALLLLADLPLSPNEVHTLNTLGMALTGFLVSNENDVVNDNVAEYASRFNIVPGYDVWFQKLQDLPRRVLAARNNLVIPEDHGIDLAKVVKATKDKKR